MTVDGQVGATYGLFDSENFYSLAISGWSITILYGLAIVVDELGDLHSIVCFIYFLRT